MSDSIRLLLVDDEEDFLDYTARRLARRGIEVAAFSDPTEALAETEARSFDVALLDLRMPGIGGDELLRRLKALDPLIEVIILTGHGSIQSAFDTSRSGVFKYLAKPCEFDELAATISHARAKRDGSLALATAAPERKPGPLGRLKEFLIRRRGRE